MDKRAAESVSGIGAVFIAMVAFFVAGCYLGRYCGLNEANTNAVKDGVARYVSDEHGRPKFEWIKCEGDQ